MILIETFDTHFSLVISRFCFFLFLDFSNQSCDIILWTCSSTLPENIIREFRIMTEKEYYINITYLHSEFHVLMKKMHEMS